MSNPPSGVKDRPDVEFNQNGPSNYRKRLDQSKANYKDSPFSKVIFCTLGRSPDYLTYSTAQGNPLVCFDCRCGNSFWNKFTHKEKV